MIRCERVLDDEQKFNFIVKERLSLLEDTASGEHLSIFLRTYGYVFLEGESITGSFMLIPYSQHDYPSPSFPSAYRPKSNLAHIGFITSSSNKNNIFDIIKAFSESLMERDDLIFPLTITAKASTNHGLLFQYICGFIRAFGKDDNDKAAYGAITINKPLDGFNWARENFKKAMLEYRRDIDKYQHAIHP